MFLYPALALIQKRFQIIDKSTGDAVPQHNIRIQREAFNRKFGTPNEELFLTLMPDKSTEVSTPFGPPDRQSKARDPDEDYGLVTGLDGLKVGHTYSLHVAKGQEIWWWRYGTKEEILEPADGLDAGLGWTEEPPIKFDAQSIPAIGFKVEA